MGMQRGSGRLVDVSQSDLTFQSGREARAAAADPAHATPVDVNEVIYHSF